MLEELGLSYRHKGVDVRQGTPEDLAELTALNPRAKIPALQDGSLVLAESAAILTYLADNYAGGTFIPSPKTPARATHDMWMFYCVLTNDYSATARNAVPQPVLIHNDLRATLSVHTLQ